MGNPVRTFNITQTYVDEDDPWLGILGVAEFSIFSTTNCLKGYNPGPLVFGRDIILPIKHKADWELIRKQKQTQTNKDIFCGNIKIVDHDYKVGYKFMLTNNAA